MRNADRNATMSANPTSSLWQRVCRAASSVVQTVRAASARALSFVVRKTAGARKAIRQVARAAMTRRPWVLSREGAKHALDQSITWGRDTWVRVVRPFMRVRVAVLGIGGVVIGLVVAPITTLTVIAGTGAALIGLSRLVEVLEGSARPGARIALLVLEYVAQVSRVLAYAVTAGVVAGICIISVPFALTEIAELVLRYLEVPHAASLATLAFFVMTANWGLSMVEVAWLAFIHDGNRTAVPAVTASAVPLIRTDCDTCGVNEASHESLGAHGGAGASLCMDCVEERSEPLATEEEMQETFDIIDAGSARIVPSSTCEGCGKVDANPRFGIGNMSALCGECFKYLLDDELIMAANQGSISAEDVQAAIRVGIQIPAYVIIATGARLRSTRIDLDREAITCRTEARVRSEQDVSKIHWAETAWWFDGRGGRRARRWHGYVAGRDVTYIEYKHEKDVRGFYTDVGDIRFKTLAGAQECAADEVSDRMRTKVEGPRMNVQLTQKAVS